MSEWKDSDEVTTTYGSIQLSLEQCHAAGIKTERERIIKILTDQLTQKVSVWDESLGHPVTVNQSDLIIALIKGDTSA